MPFRAGAPFLHGELSLEEQEKAFGINALSG